jgi:hypothetical protein
MFSSKLAADQMKHRNSVLVTSLKFLLRQGLAVRGHEEGQGNIHQIVKLRMHDVGVSEFDTAYMSREIENELIAMMGHTVLRGITNDI